MTINGQGYQDTVAVVDSASTNRRTYTINSHSISASVVNQVIPGPITWQGLLSEVALYGSTAATPS